MRDRRITDIGNCFPSLFFYHVLSLLVFDSLPWFTDIGDEAKDRNGGNEGRGVVKKRQWLLI